MAFPAAVLITNVCHAILPIPELGFASGEPQFVPDKTKLPKSRGATFRLGPSAVHNSGLANLSKHGLSLVNADMTFLAQAGDDLINFFGSRTGGDRNIAGMK